MNDFYTITWGEENATITKELISHFLYSKYVLRIGQTHVTEKLSSDTDREDEAYLTVCLINRLTSLNINQIMTQDCSGICQMNGPIIITNPVLSSQNFKTFDTLHYSIVLGKSWLID